MKNIMGFFRDVNSIFVSRLGSLAGASVLFGSAIGVYGIIYLLRDVSPSPIWIVWWMVSGSYGASVGGVLYNRYLSVKRRELNKALANPSGMTWTVETVDGAKIGELEEGDYLKAKFTADTCFITKLLQGTNIVWMGLMLFVRTAFSLPAILVIFMLLFGSSLGNDIQSLTLGELISSPVLSSVFWSLYFVEASVFILRGGSSFPGYKNFYELRLRRLISEHLPNIANANGFSVNGVIVDWETNKADCSTDLYKTE